MDDPERISIPLEMIAENLEVLLNNMIPVESIGLSHHGVAGVVLTVTMSPAQKQNAKMLGFETRIIDDEDDEDDDG
jgi:hypothetical protein